MTDVTQIINPTIKPAWKTLEGQILGALALVFTTVAGTATDPWVKLGAGVLAALMGGTLTYSRTTIKARALTAAHAAAASLIPPAGGAAALAPAGSAKCPNCGHQF